VTGFTAFVSCQEHTVVCTAGDKPLVVLHLVLGMNRVLCFAGSIETAKRLALLIQTYVEHAGK